MLWEFLIRGVTFLSQNCLLLKLLKKINVFFLTPIRYFKGFKNLVQSKRGRLLYRRSKKIVTLCLPREKSTYYLATSRGKLS